MLSIKRFWKKRRSSKRRWIARSFLPYGYTSRCMSLRHGEVQIINVWIHRIFRTGIGGKLRTNSGQELSQITMRYVLRTPLSPCMTSWPEHPIRRKLTGMYRGCTFIAHKVAAYPLAPFSQSGGYITKRMPLKEDVMSKTGERPYPQTGKWESKKLRASQGRKNHSAVTPAPEEGMEKAD